MPKQKNDKGNPSPLEKEIRNIIKKYNREVQMEIASEDLAGLLSQLTPTIDQLIANKVKQHFVEIAEFINEKFGVPEE